MTNSSSNEDNLPDEEREKIYEETGVDDEMALKALLTDLSKCSLPLQLIGGGV